MNEIPDITKAWSAGLFDGEGCINIQRAFPGGRVTPPFILEARVTNTARQSLEILQQTFGGRIYHLRGEKRQWADCFQWYIYGSKAAQFLRCIYPYLVTKRETAQLALEFYDSCRSYTTTELRRGPQAMPITEVQRREDLRNRVLSHCANQKQEGKSDASAP